MNTIMKKTYCSPSLKAIEIETSQLIADSLGQGSDNQVPTSKAFDTGSGIWGNMTSKDNDDVADEEE